MRNCIESLREFLVGAKGSSLWGAFLYSDLLPLAIIAGSFWTGKPGSTLTPERGVNISPPQNHSKMSGYMRDSFPLVEIDNQNEDHLFIMTIFENRPLQKAKKCQGL
jgi:hypothetical protein